MNLQDRVIIYNKKGKPFQRFYTAELKNRLNPDRKGQRCDSCGYFYHEKEIDFIDGLWLCKKCQRGLERQKQMNRALRDENIRIAESRGRRIENPKETTDLGLSSAQIRKRLRRKHGKEKG